MRPHHRGRRAIADRHALEPIQRGFTPYQCIKIYHLWRNGVSQRVLAHNLEVSQSTINRAIRRGEDAFVQSDLTWLRVTMGNPGSARPECGHPPIKIGDEVVCVVCCVSGLDEIDKLRVTAADLDKIAGKPEPKEQQPMAQRKFGTRKRKKNARRD